MYQAIVAISGSVQGTFMRELSTEPNTLGLCVRLEIQLIFWSWAGEVGAAA
jgi:hypothetical protein